MHFAAHIPNNRLGYFLDGCIFAGLGIVVENAGCALGRSTRFPKTAPSASDTFRENRVEAGSLIAYGRV